LDGYPDAEGGGLFVHEVGGQHFHGGGEVGAEVAVAGASVQVTERIGGAHQGFVHAGDEGAAEVVGQGLGGGVGHRRAPCRGGVTRSGVGRRIGVGSPDLSAVTGSE